MADQRRHLVDSAGQRRAGFDFEIRVSDGNGGVTSQAWTVSVTDGEPNQPPIITSTPRRYRGHRGSISTKCKAFDLEREELTYTLEVVPAGAEITEGGNIGRRPRVRATGSGVPARGQRSGRRRGAPRVERRGLRRPTAAGEQPAGDNVRGADAGDRGARV